jgi:hypothetical protein
MKRFQALSPCRLFINDAGDILATGIKILVVYVVDIGEKVFPRGIDTGDKLIAVFFGFYLDKNADL